MPTVCLVEPSGRYLSFAEREEIALLRAGGHGVREIARQLNRSPSTISRELRRNASTRGGRLTYRATIAQWHAERPARRPKPAKLAVNEKLRRYVQERLAGVVRRPDGLAVDGPRVPWRGRRHGRRADRRWAVAWSPEQISNRLRRSSGSIGRLRPRRWKRCSELGRRVQAHVALDGMEAAAKQINVRLDGEHARKLAELARERHVEEVDLAGEVLAGALDDAGSDDTRITEILDSIPGAWERAQEGLEQARRGETVPLADLL